LSNRVQAFSLVLLDNFSSQKIQEAQKLYPNLQSMFQPLDAGVILSFETKFRLSLMRFVTEKVLEKNFNKKMVSIARAMDWLVLAHNSLSL
jgi:DDE superfamily endonuclease